MKIITSGSKYIDIDAYASIIAYRELLKLKGIEAKAVSTAKTNESITGITDDFAETYFMECEEIITNDLKNAIQNDTKVEKVSSVLPLVFGQLLVWNKDNILKDKQEIIETLENIDNEWMMNLICLMNGKSYIIANNIDVKNNLERLLNGKFQNDIMELEEVWLRKEIIKKARSK